jgi:hypothetical protein
MYTVINHLKTSDVCFRYLTRRQSKREREEKKEREEGKERVEHRERDPRAWYM